MRLIGYRVSAKEAPGWGSCIDEFELPQAALECARMLWDRNWREIEVSRVLATPGGDEVLERLEWRQRIPA